MENPQHIFEALCLAAQQGGAVANIFRGKVRDDRKDEDVVVDGESDHVRALRTAKTSVDEAVQEIILLAAAKHLDTEHVLLDAEEKTPSLQLFPAVDSDCSLIIDPIDGTFAYLQGRDTYSVCIGMVKQAQVTLAIVFFPATDVAYVVAPDGKSYTYEKFGSEGIKDASQITLPDSPSRIVHVTRRTPKEISERFERGGFGVKQIDEYSEGLLTVLAGESAGYFAAGPQIRDILLGPVIGNAVNGFMCDHVGNTFHWPQTGRIGEAFFGNVAFEKEFRKILS